AGAGRHGREGRRRGRGWALNPAGSRRRAGQGDEVTVLLWWEPFGRPRRLTDCRRRYNVSGCRLSADRGRLGEARAVLFHHRDLALHGAQGLPRGPPPRPQRQLWVWMNFESPSHSPGLQGLGGVFNWTMSYRRDSDVFVPYGYLHALPQPRPFALPRKTRLVAWVISNWNEEHARVRYYRQLKEHLAIDCVRGAGAGAGGGQRGEDGVGLQVLPGLRELAAHRLHHREALEERLRCQQPCPSSSAPAGPTTSASSPPTPSSTSMTSPAPGCWPTYLKFLDKNKPSYRRYFAWRNKYEVHVTSFWDEHYCKVCEAVRTAGNQVKTVRNLASWFES
uniref:Fucosyltransferase n=1 Tax=Anas platyrhynchos TaxID=8839 RepID=A0A8B9R5C2_ANAPL